MVTVLEEVPEDTRLWKPETAPQATVTNRMGNMVPSLALVKPVNTGRFMTGWLTIRPRTAPTIMATNIKVVMWSRGCFSSHMGRTAAKKMYTKVM